NYYLSLVPVLLILFMAFFSSRLCLATQMDADSMIKPDFFASDDFLTTTISLDDSTQPVTIAVERLKQGRFKQAFGYARATLRKDPKSIPGHGVLGIVFAFTGQKEKAQKELAFLIEHTKGIFYPEMIKAMLYAQEGDIKKAEKHLESSIDAQPDHPVAIYYQGSLLLAQQQYKSAVTTFERVIQSQPKFVPALAGLGRSHFMLKDMDLAAIWYEKAVSLEPENLLHRRQLLNIYQATGKKDQANNQMKQMLYYTPGVKQGYLKKGRQLLVMGAYGEAIILMDKILNIYDDIPLALYINAAALANLNRTDKAVANIEKFIDTQQNSTMAHHYTGICYMALGMYKKAKEHFKKVININPNMGKSFVPMIIIEQIEGNLPWALEGLKLAKNGGEPVALVDFLSAHIFLQQKNDKAFIQKMETGIKLIPGMMSRQHLTIPGTQNRKFFAQKRNLMILFFYNGWYGKSLEINRALLKKVPDDRFALYYKALCET
ncbi:tetratricopeptide repeat protein, partial [Desulfobacterales bacterium HSG17]|nr:tetratricopeptide repeat protein [Desulfobacterales bacterium HSG17]